MNIYDEYEKLYPRYDGIKQHPISESIAYISAYWVDVYFGGHEEGGWWYDHCEHIYSEPVNPCLITEDQVEKRIVELESKFSHLGSGMIKVVFETVKKSHVTKSKPYYS